LHPAEREFFEQRFGYGLSQVRVHADRKAAESARALSAEAFTLGSDVGFAEGRYQPGSREGRHLLAHELAHVIQQGAAPPLAGAMPVQARTAQIARRQEPGTDAPPKAPASAPPTAAPRTASAEPDAQQNLDPRKAPEFIDNQPDFEINIHLLTADRFELYLPTGDLIVPDSDVDLLRKSSVLMLFDVKSTRAAAQAHATEFEAIAKNGGKDRAAGYYRGPGGVIFPTYFNAETAPVTYRRMMRLHGRIAEERDAAIQFFGDFRNSMIAAAVIGGLFRIHSAIPRPPGAMRPKSPRLPPSSAGRPPPENVPAETAAKEGPQTGGRRQDTPGAGTPEQAGPPDYTVVRDVKASTGEAIRAGEVLAQNPNTVYNHVLTKGRLRTIVETEMLAPGAGSPAGGGGVDAVRAHFGEVKGSEGKTIIEFQNADMKNVPRARPFMGQVGVQWPKDLFVKIRVKAVHLPDGSVAVPAGPTQMRVTRPNGKVETINIQDLPD
jgi:hypothetical protein